MTIYVRKDVVELWEFLGRDLNLAMVQGLPGVGKSTVVWSWARFKAKSTIVYWLHASRFGWSFAILIGNQVYSKEITPPDLPGFLTVQQQDGILIADGVTEETRQEVLTSCSMWCKAREKGKRNFVLVSSESLRFVHQ